MFSSSGYFLIAFEATLSMMLKEFKPLFVKYVMFSFKVAIIDSLFKIITGVVRISLDYQSYRIKMDVFNSIHLIENVLVKST